MSTEDELIYCRKCTEMLPSKKFYDGTDDGFIDTNGKMSVCKDCISTLYDELFDKLQSMEKSVHKLCRSLNIRYSNEAMSATKSHIQTLIDNGKTPRAVFGIYKQKLVAVHKSMDKSSQVDDTYEDIGTIFTSEQFDVKDIPIPQSVIDFWGDNLEKEDIRYLETEYANFKQSVTVDAYSEVVLLKQLCYTLLKIKNDRAAGNPTEDSVKELQNLMKSLNISPNIVASNSVSKDNEAFGLWILDIEKSEPAQWIKSDPRGDMYRDVADVDGYFQKYFVRPLKNFILGSKDFHVEDTLDEDLFEMDAEDIVNYGLIDDGETSED